MHQGCREPYKVRRKPFPSCCFQINTHNQIFAWKWTIKSQRHAGQNQDGAALPIIIQPQSLSEPMALCLNVLLSKGKVYAEISYSYCAGGTSIYSLQAQKNVGHWAFAVKSSKILTNNNFLNINLDLSRKLLLANASTISVPLQWWRHIDRKATNSRELSLVYTARHTHFFASCRCEQIIANISVVVRYITSFRSTGSIAD